MEDEFQTRMEGYGTQAGDHSASGQHSPLDGAARAADSHGSDGCSGAAQAADEGGIEAEDLLGRLSRFMQGSAGLSGAKPEASSFSLDVNALMALLKPPGDQQGSCRAELDVDNDVDDDEFSDEITSDDSDSDADSDDSDSVPTQYVASDKTYDIITSSARCVLDEPQAARCEDTQVGGRDVDARCVVHASGKHDAAPEYVQNDTEEKGAEVQPGDSFMAQYMQHLDEELNQSVTEKLKGVDIDISCVADLLKSVEESAGQPGAAEGLIGMLGMRLPKESV
jgi:hypothetical protein